MATVEFRQASRIYDPARPPAVSRVNLTIADGEFLVLVGPSGCGKPTTLRMLAGLEPVDEGQIFIDGADVSESRARDRDVAMVFQSYALYPNMTARQNISFALENQKMDKQEIEKRVAFAAKMLQLEDLLDKKPAAMSGGQRQRITMGRAIVREPKVFLMDEPLSNLDAKLRVSARAQIAALQRELGVTTVYVTHDQTEAMTMGDRVCVLKDGILQQVDVPQVLYNNPGNTFVAQFIGSPSMTLLDGVAVEEGRAVIGEGHRIDLNLTRENALKLTGNTVVVGVRPENWEIVSVNEEPAEFCLLLDVAIVEHLGAEVYAYCHPHMTPNSPVSVRGDMVTVRAGKDDVIEKGDQIWVRPIPGGCVFFEPESEINLNYLPAVENQPVAS